MKTTERGLQLIADHEGFRGTAYLCPAGVWTIGFGHTQGVERGDTVTRERAMAMLRQDVAEAEGWLNAMFGGKLTQNQYDATVSLVYNIGIGNFRSSTLCTVMRANPLSVNVATEWRRWCRASGKIVPGLSRRRENEIALYFGR